MRYAIQARTLFDGERFIDDHGVIVAGEGIVQVSPNHQLPGDIERRVLAAGVLAPGFIDVQVNGGGGVLLSNAPCADSIERMTAAHRPTGTTAMLPTLLSDSRDQQQAGVDAVRQAQAAGNRGVLGIHIEGPFFDLEKRGIHTASMIRTPRAEDIDWLCSLADLLLVVTLAPEHVQQGQIRRLADAGVRVCAGHTNASYAQLQAASNEGLVGFTHLFNAMSPLTAREPGAVGAALDFDHTWAGIIVDGHHVAPASIRIAQRTKPRGKLLLVSDAMATVGSDNPCFELYGERIEQRNGALINADGVLAGSAIGMVDAVRIAATQVGLPLAECLRMASRYPAGFLGLDDQLGRLAPGYRADLVHFDGNFQVTDTWVAGQHRAHHAGSAR
jgi:N-acetylglucosamine-6-phosphate deacetylase